MTNEEFGDKLEQIYDYMKEILLKKNQSYGGASFQGKGIMPILGNMFRMKDKANRYENLLTKMVEKGGNTDSIRDDKDLQPFGESIWDTLCDIFGYACIGLCILEEKGMGKLPSSQGEKIRDEELDYWIKVASEKTKEATEGTGNHVDSYGNPIPHGNDPIEATPTITQKRD